MGVLFQKKNAVRDGTLVLATKKHALRPVPRSPLHAGDTTQLARILTAQNICFVQLMRKTRPMSLKWSRRLPTEKKPECEIITLWLSDHCTLKPIKSVFLHDCRIIFIGIIQVRTTGYAVDRSGMAVLPHPICTRKSGLFGFCMRHPDIMLRLTGYRHIIGQK